MWHFNRMQERREAYSTCQSKSPPPLCVSTMLGQVLDKTDLCSTGHRSLWPHVSHSSAVSYIIITVLIIICRASPMLPATALTVRREKIWCTDHIVTTWAMQGMLSVACFYQLSFKVHTHSCVQCTHWLLAKPALLFLKHNRLPQWVRS